MKLTPQQRLVAQHVAQGMNNKQIAEATGLALGTVRMHLWLAYSKLGITSAEHSARVRLAVMFATGEAQ